jgi:hypothetical protein
VAADDKTMTTVAQVDVKSAWTSKINWTQAVGIMATVLAVVSGNKYQIPVETQLAIVATIQGAQGIASWVLKTWFTKTITPASAAGPDVPTKDIMK